MKKLIFVAFCGLTLMGCTDKKNAAAEQAHVTTEHAEQSTVATAVNEVPTSAAEQNVPAEQTLNFTGPYDLTLELKTTDNFQTAQLTDNSDKVYQLKEAVSGSGVRLEGDNGVSIHFKNVNGVNEGTVELVKDKPIEIKEFVEAK